MAASFRALLHAVSAGAWLDAPGRTLLAVCGIACGVALGAAVHLVNGSARNEFEHAARALAGTADLVVRGPRQGFDERLYPRIARIPGIEAASPVVDVAATLADARGSIRILGLDPFRAASMQPALVRAGPVKVMELLNHDAAWVSRDAALALHLAVGDTLRVRVGTSIVGFRVASILPGEAYPGRLAIIDIATAQWRLAQVGRLQRIDLRLRSGVSPAAETAKLRALLPAGVVVETPRAEATRAGALTRAYRVNLDMLALVALFTGAFLVFSTQYLSLMRRRAHFALMRVLGVTRSRLRRFLLLEGMLLGVAGSALGTILGYLLALYIVRHYGTDLGAGYFTSQSQALPPQWGALAAYFALGVAFSILGAAPPALEVSARPPALALRAGDEQDVARNCRRTPLGIALALMGLICTRLPAFHGLPWAAYLGIALLLLGTIVAMPRLAAHFLRRLPLPRGLNAALAVAQLQAAPRQAAISVAAIVASVSLMVSMLIMVGSFRGSLDAWLARMLPADLYLRTAPFGDTGFLAPAQQATIAATPGIARVKFIRSLDLVLDARKPPVTLLARDINPRHPGDTLSLLAPSVPVAAGAPPSIWISEAVHDLYGWNVGDVVSLPLAGAAVHCTVAGIWRDYAGQTGAIVMSRALYSRLTGDHMANDAAIWLQAGATPTRVEAALHARLGGAHSAEIEQSETVRARSLAVFDRTFAVTYGLEGAAVLIGLFGVSAAFSAQALSRRREFGMLRHLGMTRGQIARMLGCEGALLAAFGAAVGCAVGGVIGLALIDVVNRQSFHWSMDLHLPRWPLAALAIVLIFTSAAVAAWGGRYAMRDEAARAVHEDW